MTIHGSVDLTERDFGNLLLWFRQFKKNRDLSREDLNTYSKIKALAISEKEQNDRFSRIGGVI